MNSTHTPIKLLLICLLFVVFALSASACGSNNSSDHGDMQMSSNDMPDYVQQSPPRVREAYEFAVENPFALEFQPCYCGCGAMGHLNNQDCFVKEIQPNGEVVYDNHAAGCGICVDIAQDVMRLAEEGKTPLEIRTYIDSYYSQFGPSTDTEMPLS